MKKRLKITGIILAAGVFLFNFLPVSLPYGLPERVYVTQGEIATITSGLPIEAQVQCSSDQITLNGQSAVQTSSVDLSEPISIAANGSGQAEITFKLGGIFTLRRMTVVADAERTLIPGGQCIGVAMYTKGALIVGLGDISCKDGRTVNPGRQGGLQPGDVILQVNGTEINNSDHLSQLITDAKDTLTLQILRDGETKTVSVTPVQDATDDVYRLGLWVRDSTAGIGTVTYTDPRNQSFASLGHPISDADTNANLLLKNGEIVPARVQGVSKGEVGVPGELAGSFVTTGNALGKITANSDVGLFGKLYQPMSSFVYPQGLPIGWQDEVKVGPASILSTTDQGGVKEYSCQIIRVTRQKKAEGKGMIIEITDPELLEKTNGIVQGMSGSPILQNGKIVGAVTHVFVNEPHKGYGVFIEWMLEQSDQIP